MTTYDAGIISFMYVEGKSKFSKVKNENQLEEGGAYFMMTFFFLQNWQMLFLSQSIFII